MAQLEIVNDSAWNSRAPDSYPCSLQVRTEDGREQVVDVLYPPGFSRGRLDAGTVIEKFDALTAPHLAQGARERIVEAVMAFDQSPSCAELMSALAPEGAASPVRDPPGAHADHRLNRGPAKAACGPLSPLAAVVASTVRDEARANCGSQRRTGRADAIIRASMGCGGGSRAIPSRPPPGSR